MDEFPRGADGSLKGDGESRTAVEFGLGVNLKRGYPVDASTYNM
jgi:hypothetical protein